MSVIDLHGTVLLSFALALVACALACPIVAVVARRTGAVARARPDRWGGRPTPLLGGIGIVVAALLPLVILMPSGRPALAILLGTLAAMLLGLVDDVRGLRPTSKIVGQIAIASGLAISGVRAEIISFEPLSLLLTVIWVVGLMNALNLVDNMDGLAAGIAAIAAAVLLLMAPLEPAWIRFLAAGLAGSCAGFLFHNFAPARIYMGDAGSLPLGFGLAALALVLTNTAAANVGLAVLGPLLVLGLPIFDTALVTVVRRAEGRPVSQGGRDHVSHRLAARGLGDRGAVLLLYGVAASLAVLGLVSSALGLALVPLVALTVVGLILFGVFLTEKPSDDTRVASPRGRLLGAGRTLLRFGGEIGLDVALAAVALYSAYLIRFESLPAETWLPAFLQAAPVLVPLQLAGFVLLGVYRPLWSHLSITDLVVILRAAFVGTAIGGVLMVYVLGWTAQSRGALLIDFVLLTLLVTGSRIFSVWLRHWFALQGRGSDRRVLIVGATENGEMALRLLLHARETTYHPAGFIDDDPGKHHRRIGGVPILGKISELGDVVRREKADLVILALEDEELRAEIRRAFAHLEIEMREFPRAI